MITPLEESTRGWVRSSCDFCNVILLFLLSKGRDHFSILLILDWPSDLFWLTECNWQDLLEVRYEETQWLGFCPSLDPQDQTHNYAIIPPSSAKCNTCHLLSISYQNAATGYRSRKEDLYFKLIYQCVNEDNIIFH